MKAEKCSKYGLLGDHLHARVRLYDKQSSGGASQAVRGGCTESVHWACGWQQRHEEEVDVGFHEVGGEEQGMDLSRYGRIEDIPSTKNPWQWVSQ